MAAIDTTTGYAKVAPEAGSTRQRSRSRRRRSSTDGGGSRRRRSSSPDGSRRRQRRDEGGDGSSRRRRRRSSSRSSRSHSPPLASAKVPDGFHHSRASHYPDTAAGPVDDKQYPGFDPRDQAPEDSMHGRVECQRGPLDPHAPLVRGSLRLEGVNYARYEGAKVDPDRQRAFTSAIRDDLISEAGNGVVREDILLRITPGPIKTVVLDYNGAPQAGGQPGPPSLVDAEWCIDCEYAISATSEDRQSSIAHTLFEALTSGDLRMDSAKKAYTRFLNPDHSATSSIKVVPTSSQDAKKRQDPLAAARSPGGAASPANPGIPRSGLYEESDPLEGRYTWHQRRSAHDLAAVAACPDAPRSPGWKSPEAPPPQSVGGVPVENRPLPDPALVVCVAGFCLVFFVGVG